MAELILTDQEKADDSYLDWDDASLGRLVRSLVARVRTEEHVREAVFGATDVHLLIGLARAVNADERASTLKGVTYADERLGDWEITVRRMRAPDEQEGSESLSEAR